MQGVTSANKPKGAASPYSTGGGGTVLEHTYGAVLLAALLQRSPVRGLGEDVTPTEVRFQQGADHAVDDLMVVGEHRSGTRHLHIGVRRNPVITSRNPDFIKLLADYLLMIVEHSVEIDSDQVRLGLAVAGPHTASQEVALLTQFARTHRSNKAFRSAVSAPRATNHKVRSRLRLIDEALPRAAGIAGISLRPPHGFDRLTWQLLRAMRIIDLRLEGDDPADRNTTVSGLIPVAGDAGQATDLWWHLVGLSSRYAQTAGTVDRSMLIRELSSQLSTFTAASSRKLVSNERTRDSQWGGSPLKTRQRWRLTTVAECLPEHVEVHSTLSSSDKETTLSLPPYIFRDHDRALRSKLEELSAQGGMLVAVGASSAGKSRSMYEAVREVCSDWQLLLPYDAKAIREAAKEGIPERTVIWLDDTPTIRYLGTDGLTKTEVLELIGSNSGPILIIDMLWPSEYQHLSTIPQTAFEVQRGDEWRDAREVLSLAAHAVIHVPDRFSLQEREKAVRVARSTGDLRLKEALADNQFGLTQHLAGAPQLVAHWNLSRTSHPYSWAILTAAIDIRRIGVRDVLTTEILSAAAPAYLSDVQIAEASDGWLESAIAHAAKKLHGGVQALVPIPGPSMGTILGYEVADYLQQYASISRYYEPLPASFRELLSSQITNPIALLQLALHAEQCGSLVSAVALYRRIYSLNLVAHRRLPQLLAATNQENALRELIVLGGGSDARRALIGLLAKQGRENDLRRLSASGDSYARWKLALLLQCKGDPFSERPATVELDDYTLDEILSRPREIIRKSRGRAAADAFAAKLLDRDNRIDPSPICDTATGSQDQRLAEHEGELRRLACGGSAPARRLLAELLAAQGREADLRTMAAAGDVAAQEEFLALLEKPGSNDSLSPHEST
ncbi:hypothetical protein ACFY3U_04565 [Micromonospora sp. NPDC000089]|uniref:hypothetical protein n=1 Tax=unclassified Micromonospora TaxID=2617518 RepID=UPI0036761F01